MTTTPPEEIPDPVRAWLRQITADDNAPADEMQQYARALFTRHRAVPPVEEPTPTPAGHVASEGGNPSNRDTTQDDMRAYTRGLFHLDP